MSDYPDVRLRRLRATAGMRRLLDAPAPGPECLMWPVFVTPGRHVHEPIDALPGQVRVSPDRLCALLEPVLRQGIGSILLFGLAEEAAKDADGSAAWAADGAVQRAVAEAKAHFPDLVVATDVCLCAYTAHGHCGVLDAAGGVDNDATLGRLARVAVSHAAAGADIVAPSAMMDGQVQALRHALDAADASGTAIMSYSTKFASAMYGPFREAERSAPLGGDRRGHQASSGNLRLALRESALDEREGADLLMVKPALFYLDVLARLRERTDLPIAAYNVSGEYAMLIAAADRGWGDLAAMARESLGAIRRAGADVIISYWASRYDEIFP
jgi:porphobilinogen synthase